MLLLEIIRPPKRNDRQTRHVRQTARLVDRAYFLARSGNGADGVVDVGQDFVVPACFEGARKDACVCQVVFEDAFVAFKAEVDYVEAVSKSQ